MGQQIEVAGRTDVGADGAIRAADHDSNAKESGKLVGKSGDGKNGNLQRKEYPGESESARVSPP
jgi:hypothetical protein